MASIPHPGPSSGWESKGLSEKFLFYPYGLAAKDGSITFSEPAEANIHSLKITDSKGREMQG